MAKTYSDADLMIAVMAIGSSYLGHAIAEVKARRGVDPSLGAELSEAMGRFGPLDAAAADAMGTAMAMLGKERGAFQPDRPGPAVADFAVRIPLNVFNPPEAIPGVHPWLAACGVEFEARHLLRVADDGRHAHFLDDAVWALGRLSAGAHAGPALAAAEVEQAAGAFFQAWDAIRTLRGWGLASPKSLSMCLAVAVVRADREAWDFMESVGARWDQGLDYAGGAVAKGLRAVVKAAPDGAGAVGSAAEFIAKAARSGACSGFDAALGAAVDGSAGRISFESPWLVAAEAADPELRACVARGLSAGGMHPDAGRGYALGCAAAQWAWEPKARFAAFEAMLALGADPSACGARLFVANLAWLGCSAAGERPKDIPGRMRRMAELGVSPRSIAKDAKTYENAAAACVAGGHPMPYAHALLDAGAPAGWRDPRTGESMASLLAQRGGPAVLTLLAKVLADPEGRALADALPAGHDPSTALMRAAFRLDLPVARMLLEAGADPNRQDGAGMAALHHVARKSGAKAQAKALPMVELLVGAGADPGLADLKGRTPAQAMAGKSPLPALAALLARRPQDVEGSGAAATAARAKIVKRGGQALAIVEKAVLDSDPSPPKAPKGKPSRI